MGTWSRTNILRSQDDIYDDSNLGTPQLCKGFLFGDRCIRLCLGSHAFTNKRRREAPPGCILLSQILCCWDQLWNSRQEFFCHSIFLPRLTSLSRRRSTPSYRIRRSQVSGVFHDGSSFESPSSSMEHVAISIWFCYQLHAWETTRFFWCVIKKIVSCT